jgi:hypothetical protein
MTALPVHSSVPKGVADGVGRDGIQSADRGEIPMPRPGIDLGKRFFDGPMDYFKCLENSGLTRISLVTGTQFASFPGKQSRDHHRL